MLKLNENEIKLVMCDVDGTVAYRNKTENKFVSPKVFETIQELREQRIYFVFNTGNSYITIDKIANQYQAGKSKYTKYILNANGNNIYDFSTNKNLVKGLIRKELVLELKKELEQFGMEMAAMNDTADRIFVSSEEQFEEYKSSFKEWSDSISLIKSQSDMTDSVQISVKLLNPEFKSEAEFILQKYSQEIGTSWWSPFGLDINVSGVNKFTGLVDLIELINEKEEENITLDNVIYFGDENNDLSVFKNLKNTIAMGNAAEEIKDLAYDITDSVQDEGFPNYIKKISLK